TAVKEGEGEDGNPRKLGPEEGLSLDFSRLLTADEAERVESAFRAAVQPAAASESLLFGWEFSQEHGHHKLYIYVDYRAELYARFDQDVKVRFHQDPYAPEHVRLTDNKRLQAYMAPMADGAELDRLVVTFDRALSDRTLLQTDPAQLISEVMYHGYEMNEPERYGSADFTASWDTADPNAPKLVLDFADPALKPYYTIGDWIFVFFQPNSIYTADGMPYDSARLPNGYDYNGASLYDGVYDEAADTLYLLGDDLN